MPTRIPKPLPSRRRLLDGAALSTAALWLAGCGGGSSDAPVSDAPVIQSFATSSATVYIGERPLVTATFSRGQGRVDPGIGPVSSGVAFSVPVLDRALRLTLVVEAPGQPSAERTLDLVPRYRNRYEPLAGAMGVQAQAAVSLPDGRLVIAGGSRGQAQASTAVDVFDPPTRRFQTAAHLVHGRLAAQAVRITGGPHDGKLLVVGGFAGIEANVPAELVDLDAGTSTEVGLPVQARFEHALVALPGGRVLLVGGISRDTLEIWDPVSGEFRQVAARMRHARAAPAAVRLNDGRVLIAGGLHDSANDVPAEVFDPGTETFGAVTAVADARRYGDRAHRLSNGQVLLVGGETPQPGEDPFTDGRPADSVLRFDPVANTLVRDRFLDVARSRMASVLLPGDTLLLFGGRTLAREATTDALHWNGQAATPIAALPAPRRMAIAHRLPDGRVLLAGGGDGSDQNVPALMLYE